MNPLNRFRVTASRFVFFDRGSGTERFEVKAASDGSLPVEQAASLMAIHCLVRGVTPRDFGVMIAPEEDLVQRILPIARKLVNSCSESRMPVELSRRQQEVLRALLQDASNKEIAVKLNVSVRTVKFHVSALLAKFHVQGRVALIRKAADVLLPGASSAEPPPQGPQLLREDRAASAARPQSHPLRMHAVQRASR
jgi:DNA-binding CsgD family transcriptional regulator